MSEKLKNYGIILASGTGNRYQSDIPKQFITIAGKTVLEHTLDVFEKSKYIDEIILVITPDYRHIAENILSKNNYKKISKLLNGGDTRKESSSIAINSIDDKEANVLIHDCARPLVSQRIIKDCIEALKIYQAVNTAVPCTDTILKVKNGIIESIPKRQELMCSQTPQCFKLSLIKKVHKLSEKDNTFTDDCSIIMKYNPVDIYIVAGEAENIKITYPEDIYIAEKILKNGIKK